MEQEKRSYFQYWWRHRVSVNVNFKEKQNSNIEDDSRFNLDLKLLFWSDFSVWWRIVVIFDCCCPKTEFFGIGIFENAKSNGYISFRNCVIFIIEDGSISIKVSWSVPQYSRIKSFIFAILNYEVSLQINFLIFEILKLAKLSLITKNARK